MALVDMYYMPKKSCPIILVYHCTKSESISLHISAIKNKEQQILQYNPTPRALTLRLETSSYHPYTKADKASWDKQYTLRYNLVTAVTMLAAAWFTVN